MEQPEKTPVGRPKNKDRLTPRERTFLAEYFKTGNMKQATKIAGYKNINESYRLMQKKRILMKMEQLMDAMGLSDIKLLKILSAGLKAKKIHFIIDKGKVIDEKKIKDHHAIHKFLETALKMKGRASPDGEGGKVLEVKVSIGKLQTDLRGIANDSKKRTDEAVDAELIQE